jgi:2-dehydropantoate 2-reductase
VEGEGVKVVVVGAGGVGGYFGGRLAQSGVDTTFLVRGRTLDALRDRPLRVESILGDFEVRVAATDDPAVTRDADYVLLAVKAWQIEEVARSIAPYVRGCVVPLENGIDAPALLTAIVGPEKVLGGLCAIVSYIVEPGRIRHAGAEPTILFGELDHRPSERAARLKEAFDRASVKAEVPPDILRSMWTKFLFIAPLSGIGAITRVPVGTWRAMPETRALAERMLAEILALATARAITLDPHAIPLTMSRYDNLPADATASLQRDVMEGKPSELDAQLGTIVRLAREHGVAAPVCEIVYQALLPQERKARGVSL